MKATEFCHFSLYYVMVFSHFMQSWILSTPYHSLFFKLVLLGCLSHEPCLNDLSSQESSVALW